MIFRFVLADFTKHIFVYYDELRYFMIAHSIADGRGAQIYNTASGYQKIFYSVILAPAFLTENRFLPDTRDTEAGIFSNGRKIYLYSKVYVMTDSEYQATREIADFMEKHHDDIFLFIVDQNEKSRRLADTYLDFDNVFTSRSYEMELPSDDQMLPIESLSSAYDGLPDDLYHLNRIDYIVIGNDDNIILQSSLIRPIISNDIFTVYELP